MDYFGRLFGARIVANLSAVIPITQQDLGRSFNQAGSSLALAQGDGYLLWEWDICREIALQTRSNAGFDHLGGTVWQEAGFNQPQLYNFSALLKGSDFLALLYTHPLF